MALLNRPERALDASRYAELGRFGKSHALDGEIRFFCLRGLDSLIQKGSLVYITQKDAVLPLRVLSVREQPGQPKGKNETILFFVKLDRIQSREEADRLRDHFLFVQKSPEVLSLLGALKEEIATGYEGFKIYNHDVLFGEVKEVLETAAHPVLLVETTGKEVLIPCTEPFIFQEDRDHKILYGRDLELFSEI